MIFAAREWVADVIKIHCTDINPKLLNGQVANLLDIPNDLASH
jgi:hypothetical protein